MKQPITVLDKEGLLLRDLLKDHKAINDCARMFGRDSQQVVDAMLRYNQRVLELINIHPTRPYRGLPGDALKKEFLRKVL